jgi:CubicO group peptidase (beta-lactamase class C family)
MSFLSNPSFCCRRRVPRLRVRAGGPLEARIPEIGAWVDTVCASRGFNGAVVIARSGRVLLERCCGSTNLDHVQRITPQSSFSLASLSKPFTGLAIAMLAYRRRLGFDDAMARYIPELGMYPDITIRQLLHHTSGIPDHMQLAEANWNGALLTTADVLRLYVNYRPDDYFAPGTQFEYSNAGYVMLGEIITRVSGRSYPDFMASEIFGPLRMTTSAAFNLTCDPRTVPNRVFGMRRRMMCFGAEEACDLNYLDGVFGDAGIYSSAADLLLWDDALRRGVLLPHSFYAQAYQSGRLSDGYQIDYGFGWDLAPDGVFHRGEWQGFTTFMLRDLAREVVLIVLSNRAPTSCVDTIVRELRDAIAAPDAVA